MVRKIVKTSLLTGAILCGLLFIVFTALNFSGELFVKEYLQGKVRKASQGVYDIGFERFRYNLFTGNTVVKGFRLIPNEGTFEALKNVKKAKRTLYSFSYDRMELKNLNLKEIYFNRTIHLREIELDKPVIYILSDADSLHAEKGKFKKIYHEIYPLLSALFSEVKIDSILVNEGAIYAREETGPGKTGEGEWSFSAVLRDFHLSTHNYFTEGRVFYSKDVELRIRNFSYALADSLYFLIADEVGFALADSRIFGKEISLTPNFAHRKLAESHQGTLYQAYVPEIDITGIDLFDALVNKELSASSLVVHSLVLRTFRHDNRPRSPAGPHIKGVNISNLFSVISGRLKHISLDTLSIQDATFAYFKSVESPQPQAKISKIDLLVNGFRLDSLTHLDTSRIMYSQGIALRMQSFSLALDDNIHFFDADRIIVDTRRQRIDLYDARIATARATGSAMSPGQGFRYHILFPALTLDRIDLCRLVHSGHLSVQSITIPEPEVDIYQEIANVLTPPPQTKTEPFADKLHLARILAFPYIRSIRMGTIRIGNARITFHDEENGSIHSRVSGLVDLIADGLVLDPVSCSGGEALADAAGLDLSVRDFRYESPDSLHRLSWAELTANTVTSSLEINDLFYETEQGKHSGTYSPFRIQVHIKATKVQELEYRKWFEHQIFSAENGNLTIRDGSLDLSRKEEPWKSLLTIPVFDLQLNGLALDLSTADLQRKWLKYRFLSFRLDPDKPVIAYPGYSIMFSRFLVDSDPPAISIKDLQVLPLPSSGTDEPRVRIAFTAPSTRISGFDLDQIVFEKNLDISEVDITDPEMILTDFLAGHADQDSRKQRSIAFPVIDSPFHFFAVGGVHLKNGTIRITGPKTSDLRAVTLNQIDADFRDFRYPAPSGPGNPPLFWCRDISVQTGGFTRMTKDSMYSISVAKLRLSTATSELFLDSVCMIPRYSDSLFSRKLGYQEGRFDIRTGLIHLSRLNFRKLLDEKRIEAGKVVVNRLMFDDFHDKRVPPREGRQREMPQDLLRKIEVPVIIDTLLLKDTRITYREQTGVTPGILFLDRMELLFRNFTNDPARITGGIVLEATGSARLLGKGHLEGTFRFPLDSPSDTFTFTGRLGAMDLTVLNPLISHYSPVRINSGMCDSLCVHLLAGDSTTATGTLDFYYHDLKLGWIQGKKGIGQFLEAELNRLLLDLVIPQDNQGVSGRHHTGYIWCRRKPDRGFMNYFWKSVYSGLKSGEGLNTREQRSLKKKQ